METATDPLQLAAAIAQAAADTKAMDIVVLDMRGLVDYTNAFVLCSGRSSRQVGAIADAVRAKVKTEFGVQPMAVEGKATGKWVLVDFSDVVVHVFEESMRSFYDLDGLWADAPRLEAPPGAEPEEPRFF